MDVKSRITNLLKVYDMYERIKILNYTLSGKDILPKEDLANVEKMRMYDNFSVKIKEIVGTNIDEIRVIIGQYTEKANYISLFSNLRRRWYIYLPLLLLVIFVGIFIIFIPITFFFGLIVLGRQDKKTGKTYIPKKGYQARETKLKEEEIHQLSMGELLLLSLFPGLNAIFGVLFIIDTFGGSTYEQIFMKHKESTTESPVTTSVTTSVIPPVKPPVDPQQTGNLNPNIQQQQPVQQQPLQQPIQ